RADCMQTIASPAAAAGERVFFAPVADRAAIVYSTGGRIRRRVLGGSAGPTGLTMGESADAGLPAVARAHREADQALQAGLRSGRRHTSFADIGAAGLLGLLATPDGLAVAGSLLPPPIDRAA